LRNAEGRRSPDKKALGKPTAPLSARFNWLMAYLTGVDASRDQDVRRTMFRLSQLAERLNCVVVCQRRLNKSGGDKAIYRGGASTGIVTAARTGLVAAADPNDAACRVLAATKCNSAAAEMI
jgi:hypothetical protein